MKGSCLCGSISYSADADPVMVAACHCKDCQKQTGTTYSVIVGVPEDSVKVTGDPKTYQTIGESTHAVNRKFCGDCGSPLLTSADVAPGLLFIKAGTLDEAPPELKVSAKIWCDSKAAWAEIDPSAREFANNAG